MLPGGEVKLAVGGEYREESVTSSSVALQASVVPVASSSRRGRSLEAAYAELLVPIFGAGNRRAGLHRLEISLAARYERYSDFGSTTNPKLGIAWSPAPQVSLRGSYGTSFLAPTLQQLSVGQAGFLLFSLPDAASEIGQTLTLIYLAPGNPSLQPQEATNWSVGMDLQPSRLPGLKVGLSYFDIDYEGLIGSIGLDLASALLLEDIYGPLITRNPDAAFVQAAFDSGLLVGPPVDPSLVGAFVNAAPTNLGVLRQNGLDLNARWHFTTGLGLFGLQTNVTYLLNHEIAQTSEAPLIDRLDTLSNPIGLRVRNSISWSRNGWGAALSVNYTGGYENPLVTPAQKIDSWTTVDFNLFHTPTSGFWSGASLALHVQNLLNADPPFVNSPNYGYDPSAASPVGCFVGVQLKKTW